MARKSILTWAVALAWLAIGGGQGLAQPIRPGGGFRAPAGAAYGQRRPAPPSRPYPAPYGRAPYGRAPTPYAPAYPMAPYAGPAWRAGPAWQAEPAWRAQQEEARFGVRRGAFAPLGVVIAGLKRRAPGRQLDTAIDDLGGRPVYRVRWITARGRRIDFVVDAASGAILSAR